MSRSFKHTPCCILAASKSNKVIANRRVRRKKSETYNGSSYKKLFETYDIVDFKDISTRSQCKNLTDNEYDKYYVRK